MLAAWLRGCCGSQARHALRAASQASPPAAAWALEPSATSTSTATATHGHALEQLQQHRRSSGEASSSSSTPMPAPAPASAPSPPPGLHPVARQLMHALLQPLPVGRTLNSSLHGSVVQLNGVYVIDPAKTLESTMRVLEVVKQVLAGDGHVAVLNCNPAFQPLMQEAALHCTNPNVFFSWKPWSPGALQALNHGSNQPIRQLLRSRSMAMVNVHCPKADPLMKPRPALAALHKWRLLARRRHFVADKSPRAVLGEVLAAETRAAKLPLQGTMLGKAGQLQLLVVLDLSHGAEAIQEAFAHGVLTASVVNAHTPMDRVTYPIYAGEGHPAFQHFLLDWLLKVANMAPPPQRASAQQAGKAAGAAGVAAAAAAPPARAAGAGQAQGPQQKAGGASSRRAAGSLPQHPELRGGPGRPR